MGFESWSADNKLCPGAEIWKIMGEKNTVTTRETELMNLDI